MTYKLGLKLLADAWNVDVTTMYTAIILLHTNQYSDAGLCEYEYHCMINDYIISQMNYNLDDFKNFGKLPYDDIKSRISNYDYLKSRSWSSYLYEQLSKFDSSITQSEFEEMCTKSKSDKTNIGNAIYSGEITDILKAGLSDVN